MGVAPFSGMAMGPAKDARKITPGTAVLNCDAFIAAADGTATFVTLNGSTATNYPIQKGYNPIGMQTCSAATAEIWALYTV